MLKFILFLLQILLTWQNYCPNYIYINNYDTYFYVNFYDTSCTQFEFIECVSYGFHSYYHSYDWYQCLAQLCNTYLYKPPTAQTLSQCPYPDPKDPKDRQIRDMIIGFSVGLGGPLIIVSIKLFCVWRRIQQEAANRQNNNNHNEGNNVGDLNINNNQNRDISRNSLNEREMPYIEQANNSCAICLDGRPKAELLCGHSFHYQCINQWNARSNLCPICRKIVKRINLKCNQCHQQINTIRLRKFDRALERQNFECSQCEVRID